MGTGTLGPTGYDPKRLEDVRAGIESKMRAELGQSLVLDSDSPEGKIIGIVSEQLTELWELSESIYNATYPSGASDVSLDRVGEITNILRRGATKSTVVLYARGNLATIPKDSLIEVVDAGDQFETLLELILPAENKLEDCTAGGILVQAAGIATQTWVGHNLSVGDFVWYVDVTQSEYNGVKEVLTTPTADTYTFAVDSGATSPATGPTEATVYQTYPVNSEAVLTGPTQALADTLTEIASPVPGWDAVTNQLDAVLGVNQETDTAYRLRRIAALTGLGNATVDAIQGDLLVVLDVLSATVFENETDVIVDGRPPHSIECLLDGGADDDIAQAIWDSKAGGIATFGVETGNATDANGDNQVMNFSRPSDVDIYLDLTLTVDGDYPTDGDAQVELLVLAFGDALEIGEDVVVYPYLISSFSSVPGITDIVVDIGIAPAPSGDANIIIAATERAKFDSTRTTVTS